MSDEHTNLIDNTSFNTNLNDSISTLQDLARAVDRLVPANAVNADTVDGSHASAFAPAAKGVTNGDSHDHNGGDGAQINHANLSNIGTNTHAQIDSHLANTSNPHSTTAAQVGAVATGSAYSDLSTSSKIGTGAAQVAAGNHNHAGVYEPANANIQSHINSAVLHSFSLEVGAAQFNPASSTTYYWAHAFSQPPQTIANRARLYLARACTLTGARIFWNSYGGSTGSGESISLYVRYNNEAAPGTLIQTVANTNAAKLFSNLSLNIACAAGAYLDLVLVTPTWITSPTNINLMGLLEFTTN